MEAQTFYEIFQDQLQSLNVQELMGHVLDTLMRTFRAQAGVILLRERRAKKLEAKAWKGLDAELAAEFNTTGGRGMAGRIAKSGESMVVVDVRNEPLIRNAAIRKAFRSVWGVPLTVRGEVRGVLQLGFSQEYHCLPCEMTLLEAVAERCALAIDKAKLLEELHDEVGQSMQVIRLYLEMIRASLPEEARDVAERLVETQSLTEQTIEEMRRLIAALSPNVLEDLGLPASIRQFVSNFRRTFSGDVDLQMSGLDHLPKSTQIMVYRLVQECFSNIIKHSHANQVGLRVGRRNGRIHLKVEDDGVGFDLSKPSRNRESFGLSGMRERVALLGGDIDIDSALGKGARVVVAILAATKAAESV